MCENLKNLDDVTSEDVSAEVDTIVSENSNLSKVPEDVQNLNINPAGKLPSNDKPKFKKKPTGETMKRLALDKAGFGFITNTEPNKAISYEDNDWVLKWVRCGKTEWAQVLFGKDTVAKRLLKEGKRRICESLGFTTEEFEILWKMKEPKDKFQRLHDFAKIIRHPNSKRLINIFSEFDVDIFDKWKLRYKEQLKDLGIRQKYYKPLSEMIRQFCEKKTNPVKIVKAATQVNIKPTPSSEPVNPSKIVVVGDDHIGRVGKGMSKTEMKEILSKKFNVQ